ncbi:unnamed protein product [Rotaria sp. Silwood1]|nr:unnamed protein product [Rotaria sp. Silwood1]
MTCPRRILPKCELNFKATAQTPINYKYGPRAVAMGDFNNDTSLDIVVANYAADNIAIYFGHGNGTVASPVMFSTGYGSAPYTIAVDDFDNDHRPDVVVANFGTNSIGILLRFQNGYFANKTVLSTASSRPVWIHVADLNNDAALDIITANYGTHSVSIFYGYGNASFSNPSTYSTGYDSFPLAVVSGDFNNDKQMDLAIANYGTNNVGIMLGTSNGTFARQSTLLTGLNSHPYSLVAGHLNEDTNLDIAVTTYGDNSVGILLGHGNGTLITQMTYSLGAASPYSIGIGDFNNDNRMDLVVTNNGTDNIALLIGHGNGTFASPKLYPTGSSSSISIAIGDLNSDNRSDIAFINNDTSTIGIMLGYDEFFPIQTTYQTDVGPYFVAVGDFNNDAHLDIVVTNGKDNNISVIIGYGNGSFSNQKTYSTGRGPYSEAVCDFNNDNRLDIVVANYYDNTISILLGHGNGSFANQKTYSTGTYPSSVAIGDFNHDAHWDIVVANTNDSTIGVFLNYENGSFADQTTYSTGTTPVSVAVGDFNNDTQLDIVIANLDDNTVSVLLGYGNGSFADETAYSTGSAPIAVAVGDFNNDSQLDIVVANRNGKTVSFLLGYGNGSFANQATYAIGSVPWSVAVGDFNNDTQLDIVVANFGGNTVSVLLGYSNGSFANQTTYSTGSDPIAVAVGDFNNDTRPDLVVANFNDNTVGVLLRYDRGALKDKITFAPTDGSHLRNFALFDFNNDSLLDIVVVNYGTNNIGVLLGYGNGTFGNQMVLSTGLNSHPYSITIHDFNRDGQADIAVANYDTKNLVTFLGSGNGTFENQERYGVDFDFAPLIIGANSFNKDGRSEIFVAYDGIDYVDVLVTYDIGSFSHDNKYSTSGWPRSVALDDFNNDIQLDIVIANQYDNTVSILLGYGNGSFTNQTKYSTGSNPFSVAVGDFNNDTHMDIVVANLHDNTVSVLLGYGNGSFANQTTYSTGSGPKSVAIGDFNNDTRPDIVVANWGDNTVSILLGYGNGSFTNQTTYSTGSAPRSVAVGDFNNDALLDIVVTNGGGNTVSILLGYGNGSFASQTTYSTGSYPTAVAVGDFNNDTLLDIVVTNGGGNTVSVLLGYGNGSFANQTTYSTGSGPPSIAVGDFNSDNRLDIVVTNWNDNTMSVLLGYGNGVFTNQMIYSTGTSPSSLAVGDFNNDTRLDIVVTNLNGPTASVYLGYPNEGFLNPMRLITGNGSRHKSFAIGDFNNDSQMDIAVANSGNNNIGVFLRYDNGSFRNQIAYATDSSPWSVAVGDFNNDSILDIVVANLGSDTVGIFLGQDRIKGEYSISVGNNIWLRSSSTALYVDDRWYSSNDSSLLLIDALVFQGDDPDFGNWNETQLIYKLNHGGTVTNVSAHIRQWNSISSITFRLNIGTKDLTNNINLSIDQVRTVFPSFKIEQIDTNDYRGYFTFEGVMMGYDEMHAGMEAGPVVLFNLTQHGQNDVIILSPFAQFMATSLSQQDNILQYGVMGSIKTIPANYNHTMILFYSSNGTNDALRQYGNIMQRVYNRDKQYRLNDITINYLGYCTDGGAYYYYNTESGLNYEETVLSVHKKITLPFHYIQLDSWWYYKGLKDGVSQWKSRPDIFPDGLPSVYHQMDNIPLAAHNRYWALDTGLIMYEQDWLHAQTSKFIPLRTDINLGEQWLISMVKGAEKAGITIQYCSSYPRHALQALEIPRVTHARVSSDYTSHIVHKGNQWNIGIASMLADALGIAPFKDVFWSTSNEPGSSYKPSAMESLPDREIVLATLSTDPVGLGDAINYTNIERIMRCCRKDGLILKPDRPITMIDSLIADWAENNGDIQGELFNSNNYVSLF